MKFNLIITPSINPKTRRRIENILEEDGYIILGGGQSIDGTSSNVEFEREDPRD